MAAAMSRRRWKNASVRCQESRAASAWSVRQRSLQDECWAPASIVMSCACRASVTPPKRRAGALVPRTRRAAVSRRRAGTEEVLPPHAARPPSSRTLYRVPRASGSRAASPHRAPARYDRRMGRRNRRDRKGRWDRWDDAEAWPPRPDPRARREARRRDRDRRPAPVEPAPTFAASPPTSLLPDAAPATRTCGRCQEWIGDELGGRGECLHPGSGILRPWWDTPACPFFH
jgi:hypothetical protein